MRIFLVCLSFAVMFLGACTQVQQNRGQNINEPNSSQNNSQNSSQPNTSQNTSQNEAQNAVPAHTDPKHIVGHLEILRNVEAPFIRARNVRVWLPTEYIQQTSRTFPVIYFHDGQNAFDATTSDGGTEWRLDETSSQLAANQVGPAIIVAIDSVNEIREDEYDPTTREGENYIHFVAEYLKPMIDSRYRTLADREHTWTMGSSLGASMALGIVFKKPEVFSAAACLSLPALVDQESLIHWVETLPNPPQAVRIYMDHGTAGEDANYASSVQHLVQVLTDRGFDQEHLVYKVFEGADHGEGDWAKRASIPLRFFYQR